MKEETNNNTAFSKEEVAIINATFKLYEIVILHRIYKRGGGKHQFTRGALLSAKNALVGLRPSVPGTNPAWVAALLAKDHDLAKAAVLYAIEGMKKAKQEMWDAIRSIELSEAELKNLSDEAAIFKMYRSAANLDRMIRELAQAYLVSRIAHLASTLADKVRDESNALPAGKAA